MRNNYLRVMKVNAVSQRHLMYIYVLRGRRSHKEQKKQDGGKANEIASSSAQKRNYTEGQIQRIPNSGIICNRGDNVGDNHDYEFIDQEGCANNHVTCTCGLLCLVHSFIFAPLTSVAVSLPSSSPFFDQDYVIRPHSQTFEQTRTQTYMYTCPTSLALPVSPVQVKWQDADVSLGCSDTTVDYVPTQKLFARVRGVKSSVVHFSQLSSCSRIYLILLVVTFSPACSLTSPIPCLFLFLSLSLSCGSISEQLRCGFRPPSVRELVVSGDDRYLDHVTTTESVHQPLFFVSSLVTVRKNFLRDKNKFYRQKRRDGKMSLRNLTRR